MSPAFLRRTARAAIVLLLAAAVVGLVRLRFDTDVLNLLPGSDPVVQGLKLHQQHFPNTRELLITLATDGDSAADVEPAARALAVALRSRTGLVASVTWRPPWEEEPLSAAEFLAMQWLNQPPEIFNLLAGRFEPGRINAELALARERLATSLSPAELARLGNDPFGLGLLPGSPFAGGGTDIARADAMFASTDGHFRLLTVRPQAPLATYRDCQSWMDAIRSELAAITNREPAVFHGIRIAFTGRPAFVEQIAGSMEQDITGSVLFTVLVVLGLFWWAHRRWKPLLWLLTLLGGILVTTLGLGSLLLGPLNVVSVGFAAILLGLAVDYAMVLYQEAASTPGNDARRISRLLAPDIAWSAATTAGAFAVLNFSGVPGLGQLGTLVAVGITLAAVVMLLGFLPPLLPVTGAAPPAGRAQVLATTRSSTVWIATVCCALAAVVVLGWGFPPWNPGTDPLRPRHVPAYITMEEMRGRLGVGRDPLWLVVDAKDERELHDRLAWSERELERGREAGVLDRFLSPRAFVPVRESQSANKPTATRLAASSDQIRQAMLAAGFAPAATRMTGAILEAWGKAAAAPDLLMPDGSVSRWILDPLIARAGAGWHAMILVWAADDSPAATRALLDIAAGTPPHGGRLAGWTLLGPAIAAAVLDRLPLVLAPMAVLLGVSLWLAFRRLPEVLLSLATLAFSMLCLLAAMRVLGTSWNLMNALAVVLLLGCGVDYSIHVQLALRRHGGDRRAVRAVTGKALFLCAGTTVAGFGSNAFSSNPGLASLGLTCAGGIAIVYLTATSLLPVWWSAVQRKSLPSATPSSLYGGVTWRLGLVLASLLPRPVATTLARMAAAVYGFLAPHRRRVVTENLLPVVGGDRDMARAAGRRLLRNFAAKLVDLWREEAGKQAPGTAVAGPGWDALHEARREGRGVLLVTPHLGNWEFGAPLVAERGVPLTVLTSAEPDAHLTRLRSDARSRRGIDTIVVGEDPFSFVEVLRRLNEGGVVALLVDRPAMHSAAAVNLFGRQFMVSVAPAELARATGCLILPVSVLSEGAGHVARALAPVGYDRVSLRSPEARRLLAEEILRAFEPLIRQHPDQWFHFVPIWPEAV